MSTPTVPVTVTLAAQDGTPYEGVTVRARLDRNEVHEGIVISDQAEAVTDASGVAVLNCFPNAPSPTGLGTQGSTYRFHANIPGGRSVNVDARVPNAACRLENILVLDEIGPLSAAELAVLQAQASVGPAAASAAAAATSATTATTKAGEAATSAANASASATAAAGSASAANTSATTAEAAADAASTYSAAAQVSATSASVSAIAAAGNAADGRGVTVADYPALRAYNGPAANIFVLASGIAGTFVRDDSDTTSGDNNGTILVASNGKRWKRAFSGAVGVRWFGAKADNATDDTAAIQAAIDAAFAAGGGGVFLTGKHKISAGLVVKYGVTLWGIAGQAERSSTANGSAAGLYCTGAGYDAITIGTAGNATSAMSAGVKGVSIFNAPQAGIVVNSHGATIEGCGITFAQGSGIILNAGSGPTLIDNTHVICPGKHGIEIRGGDNRIISSEVQQPNFVNVGLPANTYDCIYVAAGPLQVMNCRMGDDSYRSRACLYFDTGSGGAQLIGNDFQNFTRAAVHFAAGAPLNFNIVGNKFTSASTDANKCAIRNDVAVSDVIVVGNYFNGIVSGGLGCFYLGAPLTKAAVRGNVFTGNWNNPGAGFVWVNAADRDTSSDNGCDFQGVTGIFAPASVGRTLVGATPSIARGASADLYWLNNAGATNVTDFLNGYPGQEITLLAVNGNSTIVHNNSFIRLQNNESWTMPQYSILRLKKAASTFTFGATWYEIGRMTGAATGTSGISVGGDTRIFAGTGSPEGVVTAPVGCMYQRKDGGAGTALYVKESGTGNTGWVAK